MVRYIDLVRARVILQTRYSLYPKYILADLGNGIWIGSQKKYGKISGKIFWGKYMGNFVSVCATLKRGGMAGHIGGKGLEMV